VLLDKSDTAQCRASSLDPSAVASARGGCIVAKLLLLEDDTAVVYRTYSNRDTEAASYT
jgi:hypothetical protein